MKVGPFRVVVDPSIPPDQLLVVDPRTGSGIRVINVGVQEALRRRFRYRVRRFRRMQRAQKWINRLLRWVYGV